MRISLPLTLCGLTLLSTACGGSAHQNTGAGAGSGAGATAGSGGGTASGTGAASGTGGSVSNFPEASHPPLPQVKNFGGPVVATPHIVTITFPGDPYVTQIDDFGAKLGATSYFTNNMAEYGVAPATLRMAVHLTSNPWPTTVDDTAIKSWLAQEIGGTLPANDGNTIYAFFFLDSQTVTHSGGSSCMQFTGYHEEAPLAGSSTPAVYAVIARCPDAIKTLTGIQQVTGAGSHEIIEASTDPFPDTNPTYQEVEPIDFAWELAFGGGEIADMCQANADAFFQPQGFAYTVQRTWSNKQALAGHDPCVPAPAGPYFNAGAVMPDMISLSLLENGMPTTVSVAGVHIPIQSSQTIELDLFSDGPVGPWTVSATDFTVPPQMPVLDFSFDKTSGQNGDKIHLTITPLTATFTNTESFLVKSQSGGTTNVWAGLVGN
jgi:hypothetical protein